MNKIKFIYSNGKTKTFDALAKLCDSRLDGNRPIYVEWEKIDTKITEHEYNKYIRWINTHVMCMISALIDTGITKKMEYELINKLERVYDSQ